MVHFSKENVITYLKQPDPKFISIVVISFFVFLTSMIIGVYTLQKSSSTLPTNQSNTPQNSIKMNTFSPPLEKLILTLSYKEPNVEIKSIQEASGFLPITRVSKHPYMLTTFDSKKKIIEIIPFEIPNVVFNDTIDSSGIITGDISVLDSIEFSVEIASNPNIKSFSITNPDGKIQSIKNYSYNPSPRDTSFAFMQRTVAASTPIPPAKSSPPTPIPPREIANNNGMEPCTFDKICIVFVGDRTYWSDEETYESYSNELEHDTTALYYTLLRNNWFNRNLDKFGVYVHQVPNHDTCDIDTYVYCYSSEFVRGIMNLPQVRRADAVVVLNRHGDNRGSANTNVRSRLILMDGYNRGTLLLHELGHLLGGLYDEFGHLEPIRGPKLDPSFDSTGTQRTDDYIQYQAHNNCYAGKPPYHPWDNMVPESDYILGCNYSNWWATSSCSIMGGCAAQGLVKFNPPVQGPEWQFNKVSEMILDNNLKEYLGAISNKTTVIPPSENSAFTDLEETVDEEQNLVTTPTPTSCTPMHLSGKPLSQTSILLTWCPEPNASQYTLRFSKQNQDGSWTEYVDVPGTGIENEYRELSFTHMNLPWSTKYRYVLNTIHQDGSGSPPSNIIEVETLGE